MQIKMWLLGISPMVWRGLLVPTTCSLRELHGVIQIVMGWEGIHLYQFCLRSRRFGSWEVSASSPDVTLAELRLRKGTRFTYEYDLNIPWRHEIRIEDHLPAEPGKAGHLQKPLDRSMIIWFDAFSKGRRIDGPSAWFF
ncbi:MAG: plasmid pRiA4b ORF-3 family protein [Acidimicrobiales bacterium]